MLRSRPPLRDGAYTTLNYSLKNRAAKSTIKHYLNRLQEGESFKPTKDDKDKSWPKEFLKIKMIEFQEIKDDGTMGKFQNIEDFDSVELIKSSEDPDKFIIVGKKREGGQEVTVSSRPYSSEELLENSGLPENYKSDSKSTTFISRAFRRFRTPGRLT